jgi:hypothetical protein
MSRQAKNHLKKLKICLDSPTLQHLARLKDLLEFSMRTSGLGKTQLHKILNFSTFKKMMIYALLLFETHDFKNNI